MNRNLVAGLWVAIFIAGGIFTREWSSIISYIFFGLSGLAIYTWWNGR
jgi:hypothetical protein